MERKECGSDIEDAGKGLAPVGVVGDWRSDDLTTILHCLDKMVIAQAQHPKTIAANHNLYTRSTRTFKHTKGIVGVPRGLPINCYSQSYWKQLSGFERDTVSKVPAMDLKTIAENMRKLCHRHVGNSASSSSLAATNSTPGGVPGPSGSTGGGSGQGPASGPAGSAPGGSMEVDH